jgi:hypothetical protein
MIEHQRSLSAAGCSFLANFSRHMRHTQFPYFARNSKSVTWLSLTSPHQHPWSLEISQVNGSPQASQFRTAGDPGCI